MKTLREFLARSVLALVGLPVLVLVTWWGGWPLLLLAAVIAAAGLREYYRGARHKGYRPMAGLGFAAALAMLLGTQFAPAEWRDLLMVVILLLVLGLSLLLACARRAPEGVVADLGVTMFGLVYIGLGMTFFLRLRGLDLPHLLGTEPVFLGGNVSTLILVLLPVWILDTVAFAVGKSLGRHPLVPHLSPKKSWEGSLAGFAGAVLATWLLGVLWNHMHLGHALVLGCVIGVLGQLGDLSESVLKRDMGLKDFGHMLGPHGGVLDRFDGVLFVMPLAYFYLYFAVPYVG